VLPRNWDDTWHGSLGFRYQLNEEWMLQFGGAYDSSPVDVEDRTLDMPIDRQWRLAFGAQHQWSERTKIGGAFTYANYGSAEIDRPTIKGEFDSNNLLLFALNVNWTF
jgi:long-chain fatty acid transport protein